MSDLSVDVDGGDDDHDINDEDLDAFLVLIESRLRADWTSPDLSRIIASQGSKSSRTGAGNALTTLPSGNPSSPSKFLRLIKKVFHLAAKPIKLRALMSVLGLESDRAVSSSSNHSALIGTSYPMPSHDDSAGDLDGKKTDKIIWELLQKAETDDDEWVRVVAGILRGMMFKSSSGNGDAEPVNHHEHSSCRGSIAEEELKKIAHEIIQSVREAAKRATAEKEDAKCSLLKQNNDESNHDASDGKDEALSTYLIGKDSCPSFAPLRYSLLPKDTIRHILPEADDNPHYKANMDAAIFKVDAEIEQKRAEEESKETNLQKRTNFTNGKSNIASAGKVATVGEQQPTTGKPASSVTGNRADTAMLVGRASRGRFSNGIGRGGRGGRDSGASLFRPSNGLASSGRGMRGRGGALAGRSGTLSRFAGAGRGAAAAAAGKVPLARRVPGSKQALLNSARGTGGASKMKMIDVSEVQGLSTAQREREQLSTKEARKRKLMEDAKASGLRKEKKARSPNAGATNSVAGSSSESRQNWESLLEKSNKLSDEDRQNIRLFFENRTINPANSLTRPPATDESGVWRCKLNEEKQTSETGEMVKETLYLDLDYNTLGYKKTRKIKKK
ncbi:hypothetical protein ACHAWT_002452 [Skeletonema menzelii]